MSEAGNSLLLHYISLLQKKIDFRINALLPLPASTKREVMMHLSLGESSADKNQIRVGRPATPRVTGRPLSESQIGGLASKISFGLCNGFSKTYYQHTLYIEEPPNRVVDSQGIKSGCRRCSSPQSMRLHSRQNEYLPNSCRSHHIRRIIKCCSFTSPWFLLG